MKTRISVPALLGCATAVLLGLAGASLRATATTQVALDTARVTIAGTSNIHEYTASTTAVRVTRAQLADAPPTIDIWDAALKPGGVDAFEVTVPAATLTSPREGLDKNMHKALQVETYPDIAFRLLRFEPGKAEGLRAAGVLKIAGVEREVGFEITTTRKGANLCVQGRTRILMTDFGIKPPVAMLGMLKTDPKVTITFDITLAAPLS